MVSDFLRDSLPDEALTWLINLHLVWSETFAKVLRHHISDILGFVLVLQEVDDSGMKEISNAALKHLTGRVSEAHIQRDGAKQSFMILRRILKLHAIGLSVVGQQVTLTQNQFIEGRCWPALTLADQ